MSPLSSATARSGPHNPLSTSRPAWWPLELRPLGGRRGQSHIWEKPRRVPPILTVRWLLRKLPLLRSSTTRSSRPGATEVGAGRLPEAETRRVGASGELPEAGGPSGSHPPEWALIRATALERSLCRRGWGALGSSGGRATLARWAGQGWGASQCSPRTG